MQALRIVMCSSCLENPSVHAERRGLGVIFYCDACVPKLTHFEACPDPCSELIGKACGDLELTLTDRLDAVLDLRRVLSGLEQMLGAHHLPSGFRAADARTLLAVEEVGARGLDAVAGKLRRPKAATRVAVHRLEERGLVRRGPGPSKHSLVPRAPQRALLLTALGRDFAGAAYGFYEEVLRRFTGPLDEAGVDRFRLLSAQIVRGYENWRGGSDDEEEDGDP